MNTSVMVYPHERLEDLGGGLYILQDPKKFCFGIDAVLLSSFAAKGLRRTSKVAEIGTGTGIIPLLLTKKSACTDITAFEIQPEMAELAGRSVTLNELDSAIRIVNEDVREQSCIAPSSLDAVVTNPPYMKIKTGLVNPEESLSLARHEISLTAADVFDFARKTLKDKGKLYMVHKPERVTEFIPMLAERGLALKRVRFVHPRLEKPANLVLMEIVKGGKPYLNVEAPLIVYDGSDYSAEIHTIYGTQSPARQVLQSGEEAGALVQKMGINQQAPSEKPVVPDKPGAAKKIVKSVQSRGENEE